VSRARLGKEDILAEKRGKTTQEVCDLLNISYERLMAIVHTRRGGFPVEIKKEQGKLVWSRRAIVAVRRIVEEMDGKRERQETAEARRYREAVVGLGKVARELERLARNLREVHRGLRANAPTVLTKIHSLPGRGLRLVMPLGVLLSPGGRSGWKAAFSEARLETRPQQTRQKAVLAMQEMLEAEYQRLATDPQLDPSRWEVLDQIIYRDGSRS
jgi:hypothetical protein